MYTYNGRSVIEYTFVRNKPKFKCIYCHKEAKNYSYVIDSGNALLPMAEYILLIGKFGITALDGKGYFLRLTIPEDHKVVCDSKACTTYAIFKYNKA